jgi:catechol 2,3-dioxygenase-like lactoylglutathione lyase family enzyme
MQKISDSSVTIMTNNMDHTIHFYKTIGLQVKQRWENHYALMATNGITIGIHPSEEKSLSSGTVSIGFSVEHIEEAKSLLESHDISFREVNDEQSGKYLHFKDPNGTLLYFVEPNW